MSELTAQQRAARVTARLCRGERLSTADVQRICEYNDQSSAWRLMMHLTAMEEDLAVAFVGGLWFLLEP